MQWLNKVDDALDWVLGPVQDIEGDGTDGNANSGDNDASAAQTREGTTLAIPVAGSADTNTSRAAENITASNPAETKQSLPPPPPSPSPPPPPLPVTVVTASRTVPGFLMSTLEEDTVTPKNRDGNEATKQQEVGAIVHQAVGAALQRTQTPLTSKSGHAAHDPAKVYMDALQNPLVSRMHDFARASPAPTKVTIGEREEGNTNIHCNSGQIKGRDFQTKKPTHPPLPPPPLVHIAKKEKQARHPQPENNQVHDARPAQEPPAHLALSIPLPAQPRTPGSSAALFERQNEYQLSTPVPPPPPEYRVPSTLNPLSQGARKRAPRPATRARPRPTPGTIRRRLRDPSLSPPDSPPTSIKADAAAANTPAPIPPPPLFISSSALIGGDTDGITSSAITPSVQPSAVSPMISSPPLPDTYTAKNNKSISNLPFPKPDTDTSKYEISPSVSLANNNNVGPSTMPSTVPNVLSAAGIEDRVRGELVKDSANSAQSKTSVASIASSPCGRVEPVTDNSTIQVQPATNTVPLPPPTKTLDEKVFDAESEASEGEKKDLSENALTATLPPMNHLKKTFKWAISPSHAPDNSDFDAGDHENENKASHHTGESVTDSIHGWLKAIGTEDDGEKNAKKSLSDSDSEVSDSDEIHSFAFSLPTIPQVETFADPWHPSLNCYGFFRVRLLRAQRLPCTSGSSISATLSLRPWKGQIHIPPIESVDGPKGAGVCLRWDKPSGIKPKEESKSIQSDSHEDTLSHSMVHAYNSEDTPVPTIIVELQKSSLVASLGGIFDRFLCSVSIPCHGLMRNPRTWVHKWCPASVQEDQTVLEEELNESSLPLILLEACFEPKQTRSTVSNLSRQIFVEGLKGAASENEDDEQDILDRPDRKLQTLSDTAFSSLDDESTIKSSTSTPARVHRSYIAKSHLLRARSFWSPTWCSVCSKNILTGWMQGKNYECEACHIFVCRDCQLQVDACIPCGSELATIAAKKAEQYQIPYNFNNVMMALAPQLSNSDATENTSVAADESNNGQSNLNMLPSVDGIGVLTIRLLRANIFERKVPREADPNEVFEADSNLRTNGDHYVRVSWLGSKESKRTKTVLQTGKPVFNSEEMIFDVQHYGMEYKLEVVDAEADKPVGSCLLSAQGLLQWQRDDILASKGRLLMSFFHIRRYSEPRRVKLELRTGVKDGFGLNFYNSSNTAGRPKGKETSQPGEISGWLELDVHLEEDRKLFYSLNPRQCPKRVDEEFDIALIQLHIARIGVIIEDIQKLVSVYWYVISWESPQITGACMTIFVALVLRFNMEYIGSLPISILVLYMIYLAYLRISGQFKDRWTLKEKEAISSSETNILKNVSMFRPVGLLHVGHFKGKHLRSRDLGIPGRFHVSILYDPLRYADEKIKSSLSKTDTTSGCIHEVAATASSGISSNPIWNDVHESPELMRLKHLLDDRLKHENEVDFSLAYPIPQPITGDGKLDSNQHTSGVHLMPFESSLGAVVFQVRWDKLGSFQMFDNVLGEVVIPLAKLAGSGHVVEGWFRLLEVGTQDTLPGESPNDAILLSGSIGKDTEKGEDVTFPIEHPELYLRVKFSSNESLYHDMLQSDKESSKVICEVLSQTALAAQESSVGVIGSSLNTINTVRTLGGKLQNHISFVADTVEQVRNIFNFSNPRMTSFVLLGLTLVWIVFASIPTRIIVLAVGMAQFGATYYAKFGSLHTNVTLHTETSEKRSGSEDNGNPIENLFRSIPTDEDLRRTYFWEAYRLGEKEREKHATSKRQNRLDKLWRAKWHGALKLKESKPEQSMSPLSSRHWTWETAFGLLEGHRFIWWRSEKHFDTGEAPLGRIFFAGHSGLAGLSPLDLKELSKEEIPFVVSIFGRGLQNELKEQQKITLLAPSSDAKQTLENAVLCASMDSKTD